MTVGFDIDSIRKQHDCVNYFETGLWDPRLNVSSKRALACDFKKVHCIEIREDWVELGREVFKDDIQQGKYHLYLDDSTNLKNYIATDTFKEKTIFFLDAHVDNADIHNYKKKCPLFEELNAIKSLDRKDHVILVDDLRIIKRSFPWGEKSYGNIDFMQQIINLILSINPRYKISALNGHIENDVLYAYVEN